MGKKVAGIAALGAVMSLQLAFSPAISPQAFAEETAQATQEPAVAEKITDAPAETQVNSPETTEAVVAPQSTGTSITATAAASPTVSATATAQSTAPATAATTSAAANEGLGFTGTRSGDDIEWKVVIPAPSEDAENAQVTLTPLGKNWELDPAAINSYDFGPSVTVVSVSDKEVVLSVDKVAAGESRTITIPGTATNHDNSRPKAGVLVGNDVLGDWLRGQTYVDAAPTETPEPSVEPTVPVPTTPGVPSTEPSTPVTTTEPALTETQQPTTSAKTTTTTTEDSEPDPKRTREPEPAAPVTVPEVPAPAAPAPAPAPVTSAIAAENAVPVAPRVTVLRSASATVAPASPQPTQPAPATQPAQPQPDTGKPQDSAAEMHEARTVEIGGFEIPVVDLVLNVAALVVVVGGVAALVTVVR